MSVRDSYFPTYEDLQWPLFLDILVIHGEIMTR